ncbi:hypothetical protein TD95_000888 [Thielaviopsis punctulata]|uniref:Transcription factor domain-containing protein n=1 Tax=Thielaviopsis punctulata TaxID=72032 RepID=A0A0F4Z9E4_9PEZI|nr:hypothetical protein TD95_000888 [Thielaviopsis punctulata]
MYIFLMPYDDAERNPYRALLPEIAVAEPHLLSLLLAYSASHRARLLGHKEPEVRMARWITDVIPRLNSDFSQSPGHSNASIANLASTIMLSSLEIISPNAFGSKIGWQNHLHFAREMMMSHCLWRPDTNTKEGECCAFLWSWFAYLDVLGSLSGGQWSNEISSKWVKSYEIIGREHPNPDEIDCIMGFTIRCVSLLARVSELCRKTTAQRMLPGRKINLNWQPDNETRETAEMLAMELRESLSRDSRVCQHIRPGSVDHKSLLEMFSTNEAFHWAGLIHLYRRAMGKTREDPLVQEAINKIVYHMSMIRRGGTGETGFLFPMFTAGCETLDMQHRIDIKKRIENVEAHGMKQDTVGRGVANIGSQVSQAKHLMLKVWETGDPWETLMQNEFIG